MTANDKAHRRLLNAFISVDGAERHGSHNEKLTAEIELKSAIKESMELLYPTEKEKAHVGA